VDTRLAVSSKRDQRRYADRPVPDDVVARILDAGRLAGSAANRQARRFVVIESDDARRRVAGAVYAPQNVLGAPLVVAVVGRSGFDLGRAAQNMMLVAWNEGVTSCPNGIRDPEAAAAVLGGESAYVIGFGYPEPRRDAGARTADAWSARAKRLPLERLVTRV
jgi:nitroreductase